MSNLWVNIRFIYWHLQIGPDKRKVSYNEHQEKARRENPDWKLFEIYQFFGLERMFNK